MLRVFLCQFLWLNNVIKTETNCTENKFGEIQKTFFLSPDLDFSKVP
jgi:hypothetical protein